MERLARMAREADGGPERFVGALDEALRAHQGASRQSDDITVIAVAAV